MTQSQLNEATNRSSIGFFSLTMLVVASMIGAGVYSTSGYAIGDLRSPWLVLVAWLVGGAIAICGAVSYGQLAHRITENGGEYLYVSRFVHPIGGFIVGVVSFAAGFTGAGAFAAIALEKYVLPNELRPQWLPSGTIAIGAVFLATLVHISGTRRGLFSQNSVVIFKLICLTIFILIAISQSSTWYCFTNAVTAQPAPNYSWLAFATTVMWISLSYSGFNAAIYVAGESASGSATVARSMLVGTAVVTVIYILLNVIFLFTSDVASIEGRPDIANVVAYQIGGDQLSMLVRVAICLGLISSVSSVLVAGPRVYAKMASEGYFPQLISRNLQSPNRHYVAMQGAAIVLVICLASLQDLLSYLGMTLSLSAAATISTLFVKQIDFPVKRRYRLVAACYISATIVIASLACWNKPIEGLAALITLVIGVVAYGVQRFFKARTP